MNWLNNLQVEAIARCALRCERALARSLRRAVLAVLLALPQALLAATPWIGISDPIFQHLPADLETPDSVVLAIAEDRAGFLWMGTEDGLLRWDGYRYRHYRANPTSPGGLPDNFVQSLHVDTDGTLWIGTLSGGLARYDSQHDQFFTYQSNRHSLSSMVVRAIADDGRGGIWVATNNGIDQINADRGEVRQLHHVDGDPLSLPDENVRALLHDHLGRLWVGTRLGLAYLDPAMHAFTPVRVPGRAKTPLNVVSLFEDHQGRIWVGTRNGAYVLGNRASEGSSSLRVIPGLAGNQVISLLETRPGEMWLGTYGGGIAIIDTKTLNKRVVRHDPLVPNSLNEDTPWALHQDRAGAIWVATNRGVARFDPSQRAVLTIFGVAARKTGLSDNDVESVLPLPNGQFWLGLGSSGINVVDPLLGRVAQIQTGTDISGKRHPLGEVRGLASGDGDEIFLCTRDSLFRTSARERVPREVPLPGGMAVRALATSGSTLWVGTLDDGLWSLPLRGDVLARPYLRTGQLTDPRVSTILVDTDGSLWIGTFNGLNRLDRASGAVERIGALPGATGAIAAPYVSTLVRDRKGRLWVGTLSGGISIIEGQPGARRIRHLGSAEGLPNLNVDKLLESASGSIWAATDNGLAIINEDNLSIRAFGRAEGVVIPSYWVDSGAAAADGTLVFGGTDGLTLVRPEKVTGYSYQPRIVVDEVRVGGQEVPWAPFTSHTASPAARVRPDGNSLSVEFSALDYSAPERNRYAYRLEGYESEWTYGDWRHRTAAYTNLPPGHYRLQLRGSNRAGEWTHESLGIPVEVQPSWYQTTWFKIIVALMTLGLLRSLLRMRTARLRGRQIQLEQLVANQTAQLREREKQLEEIAYLDPLTGLANRRMLFEQFNKLAASGRIRAQSAVLLVDLDRFKQINDTLGHAAGDALLVVTAQRFRYSVRDSDLIFRLGGDEFAILLLDVPDRATVEMICARVIKEVFTTVAFNGAEMLTSPSIGISTYPTDGQSLEELLKVADLALYEAKRQGRATWRWGCDLGSVRESPQIEVA